MNLPQWRDYPLDILFQNRQILEHQIANLSTIYALSLIVNIVLQYKFFSVFITHHFLILTHKMKFLDLFLSYFELAQSPRRLNKTPSSPCYNSTTQPSGQWHNGVEATGSIIVSRYPCQFFFKMLRFGLVYLFVHLLQNIFETAYTALWSNLKSFQLSSQGYLWVFEISLWWVWWWSA